MKQVVHGSHPRPLTYPDWIPIEGLLPRGGERHGDDAVYRAGKDAKSLFFFFSFFLNLKMYFPDMHNCLTSNTCL